jgi:FixJ family two-component response regulator
MAMSYDVQAQVSIPHSRLMPGREAALSAHEDWRAASAMRHATIGLRRLQSVFVVSGDEYVRQCFRDALSAQGLLPIVFETAAGYLTCDKTSAPSCLVLDVVLPDICGLDLQRRLAGNSPPIIFATRRADIACSVRAIREGAFDFLTAPFEPQEVLRAVHAALEFDRDSRSEREKVNGMRERFDRLTPRERQVMRLIIGGMQNKQIAWELGISETTVQIHRGNVRRKMAVPSLAELVRVAVRLGIEPADSALPMLKVARTGTGSAADNLVSRLRAQGAARL